MLIGKDLVGPTLREKKEKKKKRESISWKLEMDTRSELRREKIGLAFGLKFREDNR